MKKLFILASCLGVLLSVQLAHAQNKYCPCPSETGDTTALCQYGSNDSSYNQYNSPSCKNSTFITNNNYSFCGYDGGSGLPKYCSRASLVTKYCPCPSQTGEDTICRYLPQDSDTYTNEYSNPQCQTNQNYINTNGYSYCGIDGSSGLTKYCKKTTTPTTTKTYFCPCAFDNKNFCPVNGTPSGQCKDADQLAAADFISCGSGGAVKYCPKTSSSTTPTGGGTGGAGTGTGGTGGTGAGGTGTGTGTGANNAGSVFGTGCNGATATVKTLITCLITDILNPLIYVIMGLALVTFLNGVRKFIQSGDNKAERAKGSYFMFYGIIGLTVMVSVWGMVKILTNTFFAGGLPSEGPIPTINF